MFGWLRRGTDRSQAEAQAALPIFPYATPAPPPRPVLPIVWLPDDPPPQVTLAQVAEHEGAVEAELCPMGDSEAGAFAPVQLVRLPPGSVVFGGGHFVTGCGDYFLAEQFPPGSGSNHMAIDAIARIDRPVIEVARDALLAGRFDIGEYGCFLRELLPRVVLCERAFPGRFVFLLPAEAMLPAPNGSVFAAIRQALAACGIGEGRVLAVESRFSYRFDSLHAVSPVVAGAAMHPDAATALREAFGGIAAAGRARIAVLRASAAGGIANRDETSAILQLRGFAVVDPGRQGFAEQVGAFKGATTVFGLAGGDLANLVFAPDGVRVIAVQTQEHGDEEIRALVRARGGWMAELRGPVGKEQAGSRGGLVLDPAALNAALDSLPR